LDKGGESIIAYPVSQKFPDGRKAERYDHSRHQEGDGTQQKDESDGENVKGKCIAKQRLYHGNTA